MKKLIKISDYYYIVDTDVKIKECDYIYSEGTGIIRALVNARYFKPYYKVIATTNPSLSLPQITNPSDELIGKEVDIEWNYEEDTTKGYIIRKGQPAIKLAIIKPISKETFVEGLPIFDTYLKSIESKETLINETLEEVAANTLKELFNFEKYKGNNPIKEAYHELTLDYDDAVKLFKAGYKHAESKMKAQYDELYALYVEATKP